MTRRLDRSALTALVEEPALVRVFRALRSVGEETRIVGGRVRDALLAHESSDIDLATTLLPDAVMSLAANASLKTIPTGIDHGTVTILVDGRPFEVTTLREDVETDGRHAVVRFGRDFARDAERRDFTINALSVDEDGLLHDTVDGYADLEAGRVRFIGDAATRIREDALRILRFFRFHARYGTGEPDEDGLHATIAAAKALDGLSRERVQSEFLKLLVAPRAVETIATMKGFGLTERIIGTSGHLARLSRIASIDAVTASSSEDAIRRLAALAVGDRFDPERLRQALRLSNAEHAVLRDYADARERVDGLPTITAVDMRRLAADIPLEGLVLALTVMDDDEKLKVSPDAWSDLASFSNGSDVPPVFPISGGDLVAAGLSPGRLVGRGLALARSYWLERGCPEGNEERERLVTYAVERVRPPA